MSGIKTAYEILIDTDIEEIEAYAEISIVIDGVLGDEYVLAEPQDDEYLAGILADVKQMSEQDSQTIEVFYLGHAHGPVEHECMCSQYVQSHKPRWSFNA